MSQIKTGLVWSIAPRSDAEGRIYINFEILENGKELRFASLTLQEAIQFSAILTERITALLGICNKRT